MFCLKSQVTEGEKIHNVKFKHLFLTMLACLFHFGLTINSVSSEFVKLWSVAAKTQDRRCCALLVVYTIWPKDLWTADYQFIPKVTLKFEKDTEVLPHWSLQTELTLCAGALSCWCRRRWNCNITSYIIVFFKTLWQQFGGELHGCDGQVSTHPRPHVQEYEELCGETCNLELTRYCRCIP